MFILYYEDMRPLSFRLVKGTNMSHVGYSPVSPYGRYHPLNTTCRPGVWVWVRFAALGCGCEWPSWGVGGRAGGALFPHGRHCHYPVHLSHPQKKDRSPDGINIQLEPTHESPGR